MTPHDELMALAGKLDEYARKWYGRAEYAESVELHAMAKTRANGVGAIAADLRALLDSDAFRVMVRDAAIGAVVWRFIDRMNDVAPEAGDPAERIVAEFGAAVMPAIDAAASGAGEEA